MWKICGNGVREYPRVRRRWKMRVNFISLEKEKWREGKDFYILVDMLPCLNRAK